MTFEQKLQRLQQLVNRMTEDQLLALGFTREEIESGAHLSSVGGGASNSTQLLTDIASAIANSPFSTTAQAAQLAAAGPIMDLTANIKQVQLKFQEAAELLYYILGGSMIAPASLTAPTGGVITSGADSATYNLLVGILQILK